MKTCLGRRISKSETMFQRGSCSSLVPGKGWGKFNEINPQIFLLLSIIILLEPSTISAREFSNSPCPDFSKGKLIADSFNVSVHRASDVLERLQSGSTAIHLYAHKGETIALYCTSLLTNSSHRYEEQLYFVLDFKADQANTSYPLHPTCIFEDFQIGIQLLFRNLKPEEEGNLTVDVYYKNTSNLFWNTTIIFHVIATPLKDPLLSVSVGSQFTLQCPIQTEITFWEHKRGKKFKDVTSTSNGVLTRNATGANAGFYRCSVRLPDGRPFVLLEIKIVVRGIQTSEPPSTPYTRIASSTVVIETDFLSKATTVIAKPGDKSSLSKGEIAGICVGILTATVIVGVILFIASKQRAYLEEWIHGITHRLETESNKTDEHIKQTNSHLNSIAIIVEGEG